MIRKERVAADRHSRKIKTGNEANDFYVNANSQSGKRQRRFGRTSATNDRGSIQLQSDDGERSRFCVAPD